GSNLKKRIEAIMTKRISNELTFVRKLMLVTTGIVTIAGPIVFGLMSVSLTHAQSADNRPKFEVASIRVSTSQDPRDMRWQYLPGGRFSAKRVPILLLITEAYNIPP